MKNPMAYGVAALAIFTIGVNSGHAQKVSSFELSQKFDGNVTGTKPSTHRYHFTSKGVVFQESLVPRSREIGQGLFHVTDSDTVRIQWLSYDKESGLKLNSIEILEIDSTKTPIRLQIVAHTDKRQNGSVIAAKPVVASQSEQADLNKASTTFVEIVQLANLLQQRRNDAQLAELQALMEFQRKMNEIGWKAVEEYGKKLGL